MSETGLCPLCSVPFKETIPYLNAAYPEATTFQEMEIGVCGECGLGTAVPDISWEEMQPFYRNIYRAPGSPFEFPYLYHFDRLTVDDRALSQWLLLKMYRNFKPEDKFCDIGPGKGRTFQTAQFLGLDLEMVAYEPDRFSAPHLEKMGVKVVEESFSHHSRVTPDEYSAIIMSHVLEHFSGLEAEKVINLVKTMLREDGIFLCEVPNAPMGTLGRERKNDSPHLTFWTVRSLTRIAEMNGLRPLYISTVGETFDEFRDWRKDDAQKKKTILSRAAATLKRSAKGAIASRFFPGNLENFVKYQRFKHLTRRNRRKNVYDVLSSPYFQSVSDRIYIQMVCSKTGYDLNV